MSDSSPGNQDRLEPADIADDFLRIGKRSGLDRVEESSTTTECRWLRLRCLELRRGGRPGMRILLAGVTRCVPASLLRFCTHGLDDGSIWDQEVPGNTGPSDTCWALSSQCVERDVATGWRFLQAMTPISVALAIVFILAMSIRFAPVHETSRAKESPKIGPIPTASVPLLDDTSASLMVRAF